MSERKDAIFRAWIEDRDPRRAVSKIVKGLGTDRPSLTFLFVDPEYDLDGLAAAIGELLQGPVMACTTAGELIGESGYRSHGMAVASIASDRLTAHVKIIQDVRNFNIEEAQRLGEELQPLSVDAEGDAAGAKQFGVLLVDGMSNREEHLSALIHGACGGLHLVGGSAGDGGKFAATHVFDGRRFRTNIAAFALINTNMRHKLFRFQHFEPDGDRLVVTNADPERRLLLELNGEPAAKVYREQLGCDALDQNLVASHPLLLKYGEEYYARGIRTWDDETLTLFCAIEAGMVIRVGRARDLIQTLEQQLNSLSGECADQELLTVSFDCILRRLEVEKVQGESRFRDVVAAHPLVGFSTYGEQFDGLHINQTMTGFSIAA